MNEISDNKCCPVFCPHFLQNWNSPTPLHRFGHSILLSHHVCYYWVCALLCGLWLFDFHNNQLYFGRNMLAELVLVFVWIFPGYYFNLLWTVKDYESADWSHETVLLKFNCNVKIFNTCITLCISTMTVDSCNMALAIPSGVLVLLM